MSADPPSDKSEKIAICMPKTSKMNKVFTYEKSEETSNSEYIETNKELQILFDEFEKLIVLAKTKHTVINPVKTGTEN